MEKDLQLLHKKIDFLTEQVMITQQRQKKWDELGKELTPIISDVYKSTVQELDEIAPHFSSEDLFFFIKKLLRNIRSISGLFDQLESATDLIKDTTPLSKEMFQTVLHQLNEMEQKGYFIFFKETLQIVDRIVSTYSEQDVRKLGENIILILDTVKQLTQPEILRIVQNVITVYRNLDTDLPKETSMLALLKEMSNPEVRRGIMTGLVILKNISAQANVAE